jgi:Xaa-Pro aminopeptidase
MYHQDRVREEPMQRTNRCLLALSFVASSILVGSLAAATASVTKDRVLSRREQAQIVDAWLQQRFETVLPELMRREGLDMWIIAAREYAEDPVMRTMLPATWLSARRRTILVFFDRKRDGVEKLAIARYAVGDFKPSWNPEQEPDQWKRLAEIVAERDPTRIGINESEHYGHADGLTATERRLLERALGPVYASRLASAERLAVGWLERRTPDELRMYAEICRLAHDIIAEGYASVVPGTTTTDDLVWWFRQKVSDLGLDTWFHPSVSIQRRGATEPSATTLPDSLRGARQQDKVIRPGDLLHCDFGITYLRLNTDTQQHAYVLRDGEHTAPEGLRKALGKANRLQDILLGQFRTGRTGNEILRNALNHAKAEGLSPHIYTHPLGYHGHGAGPAIGLWDMQGGVPGTGDYPLFPQTCHSIELNNRARVPEWDDQEVRIALEQDAVFDGDRVVWLDQRQTEFHLIK